MKLILGSSSKYRREVLEKAGYAFEVMSPDIDEKAIRHDDFYKLPLLITKAKSEALASKVHVPAFVITADQIVVCDGKLYEKPKDADEARAFLTSYSNGHLAETVSGVGVFNTQNKKYSQGNDIAKIYFKPIPEAVMEEFIRNGDPYSRAGGFAIQSPILIPYIAKIEGTRESVMGLPIHLLEKLMEEVK